MIRIPIGVLTKLSNENTGVPLNGKPGVKSGFRSFWSELFEKCHITASPGNVVDRTDTAVLVNIWKTGRSWINKLSDGGLKNSLPTIAIKNRFFVIIRAERPERPFEYGLPRTSFAIGTLFSKPGPACGLVFHEKIVGGF
jgi:hypothetical protein